MSIVVSFRNSQEVPGVILIGVLVCRSITLNPGRIANLLV